MDYEKLTQAKKLSVYHEGEPSWWHTKDEGRMLLLEKLSKKYMKLANANKDDEDETYDRKLERCIRLMDKIFEKYDSI